MKLVKKVIECILNIAKRTIEQAKPLENQAEPLQEQPKPFETLENRIAARKKMDEALLLEQVKAEAADQVKTEFLNNMRHDIRTPLSGIVGLSELLQRTTDQQKIQTLCTYLGKCTQELLRFLNEILESIEVGSGEIPLLKKRFSLREILTNLVDLHQPIAISKDLALALHLDDTIPPYLIGDPVRIYRIVLELLGNALKFTQKGEVNVTASLAKKEGSNVVVKICVEDTGVGIPAEKQQEVFVRFKRLTPSYEGIYKGAGLGLSIVKQFLEEDLKGEIYMESFIGLGSTFTCVIPLSEPLLDEPLHSGIPPAALSCC